MTVGIGVFKKKCTLVTTHAYCSWNRSSTRKKGLDYIALVHTILILYTLVIHYARKQSLVLKKNKPSFTHFVEIFHKTVVSQFYV